MESVFKFDHGVRHWFWSWGLFLNWIVDSIFKFDHGVRPRIWSWSPLWNLIMGRAVHKFNRFGYFKSHSACDKDGENLWNPKRRGARMRLKVSKTVKLWSASSQIFGMIRAGPCTSLTVLDTLNRIRHATKMAKTFEIPNLKEPECD